VCSNGNGFEFTNRFSNNRRDLPTLFEALSQRWESTVKNRPYTLRHNNNVECSHRKDQKHFYANHRFFF